MQITILAAQVTAARWVTFADGADMSIYDPAKISTWTFEYNRPNAGTLIDVNAGLEAYGAKRNPQTGAFIDASIASFAYSLSYGKRHIISISGPDVSISGEITKEALCSIPFEILSAFITATDPTTRVSGAELAGLKLKPAETPETGSIATSA